MWPILRLFDNFFKLSPGEVGTIDRSDAPVNSCTKMSFYSVSLMSRGGGGFVAQ